MRTLTAPLAVVPLVAIASCAGTAPEPPPLPPPAVSAPPVVSAAPPPAPTTTASAVASAAKPAAPPEAPATPKPTAEEWSGGKDLTAAVDGAAESGCSVSRVREWVRITCGPKNKKGKALLDVSSFLRCARSSCTSGDGNGEGEIHVVKGARVVVARLPEGRTIRIAWVWADHDQQLEMIWPAGKPESELSGRFDTNPAPREAASVARIEAGLRCCAKARGDDACIGASSRYEDLNPCIQSYLRDCAKLEKCYAGEIMPTCPPGQILGAGGCVRKCNPKAKNPCPSAEEICSDGGFDSPVCVPMH